MSPTHKCDNILDLAIRSGELSALNPSVNDPSICDHFAIHCNLPVSKPQNPKIVSNTRKLRNIDLHNFLQDKTSSTLFISPSSKQTEQCNQYNNDLLSCINMHLCETRIIITPPKTPWYNNDVGEQKRICRRLERSWRHSHSETDHQAYVNLCTVVKRTIYPSKMDYSGLYKTFSVAGVL